MVSEITARFLLRKVMRLILKEDDYNMYFFADPCRAVGALYWNLHSIVPARA